MFKHILLPTDGSRLSEKGLLKGAELARSMKARVTVLHVVPAFRAIADEGFVLPMSIELQRRYEREAKVRATAMLARVGKRLSAAKLRHEVVLVVGDSPYQEIIKTVRRKKCDAVVMASHGRSGLSSMLLGSETAKVLIHSKVPVLVVR